MSRRRNANITSGLWYINTMMRYRLKGTLTDTRVAKTVTSNATLASILTLPILIETYYVGRLYSLESCVLWIAMLPED
jgi:hypothetical protein